MIAFMLQKKGPLSLIETACLLNFDGSATNADQLKNCNKQVRTSMNRNYFPKFSQFVRQKL